MRMEAVGKKTVQMPGGYIRPAANMLVIEWSKAT